jgi:hypothetical protein
MRMRDLRVGSVGGTRRRRSGRLITHREHQAMKLRKLAARCDEQIVRLQAARLHRHIPKLQRERQRLLELAAKLEGQSTLAVVADPSDWRWGDEG